MKKIKLLVPVFGHGKDTVLPIDDKKAEWAVKAKKAIYVQDDKKKK